ncbi:MAG: nucleotidyltransferase domain-containing protein [Clostridia bacterium]|nr:nucleotidyltransferase domain-containing protein [Clostridia bacterium]
MLNVKEKHLDMLKNIFSAYCPRAEIWAYGSRVDGDSHEGSDLDLAVKSFNDENKSIGELRARLNDSNIPFLIDICEFDKLPKSFRDEIVKKYVSVFPEQG